MICSSCWFFVCLFLLAGGFVVGVFSFIFITSISWSNAPICVSEPQMDNPTNNSSRLLCVTIILSWDVSMQFQQCTRQGSDVPAVDSSRWLWSILISFLLDFFGWRICFWVKFPWVKPQVWMSEWQNSHWLQMEQDFTLRVSVTMVPDLRFSRKTCLRNRAWNEGSVFPIQPKTKPVYATWK